MGALAGVLPSSHLNQLRGERVKDLTLDEFVDSDDSFESNKLLEYSSNDSGESGETEQTTMLPIFFPESEDALPLCPLAGHISHLLDIENLVISLQWTSW